MRTSQAVRRVVNGSLAALLITFSPVSIRIAVAQEAVSDPSTQTQSTVVEEPAAEPTPAPEPEPCPRYDGLQSPTGAAAHTYTFNQATCLWENDYYTWSPETKRYTKKTPHDYVYQPGTGTWRQVVPEPEEDPATDPSGSLTANQNATDSSIDADSDIDLTSDNQTDATVNNILLSMATSGDALVGGNRNGGSALTGDALVMANIINMMQSSSGFDGDIATFSADITGDITGDLFLDTAGLENLHGSTDYDINSDLDLTVNEEVNSSIHNDITLDAQSGDATVINNTVAGDAETGDTHALLNLVNMMNSSISSGGSFLGMLNIYGNLNGDILLPDGVLNQVIANNTPTTNVDSSVVENTEILADFTNNQTITNNINMNADSGDATVRNNTHSGSANTGDAETNLTVLNLTGRNVIAANSMLVFVNVLGQWVGLIVDAPAGSTAAALGTGVTQNTTSNTNVDINATNNQDITNDININSGSGDATVRNNTHGGNATSGDSTASANVVNIMNSNFALSDWFGVLFINVFGTWNGSFGVDTAAGGIAGSMGAATGTGSGVQVFTFVPSSADDGRLRLERNSGGSGQAAAGGSAGGAAPTTTLASAIGGSGNAVQASTHVRAEAPQAVQEATRNYPLMVSSLVVGVGLLGAERFFTVRRKTLV